MKKNRLIGHVVSAALLLGGSLVGAAQQELALPMVSFAEVPLYPPTARVANVSGVVHVLVTTDGHRVVKTHVQDGPKVLSDAAEKNAKSWQFATHGPTTFTVTYVYKLVDDLKPRQNNPRVILQLPTDVEVDALRWPGTKDMAPDPPNGASLNHEAGPVQNAAMSRDMPILQEAAQPRYPPIAKAAHVTGKVTVRMTVKDGLVVKTDVLSKLDPSGQRFLETPTVENLKTWRFAADVTGAFKVTYTYEISGTETEEPTNAKVEMLPSLDVKITARPVKPTVMYQKQSSTAADTSPHDAGHARDTPVP